MYPPGYIHPARRPWRLRSAARHAARRTRVVGRRESDGCVTGEHARGVIFVCARACACETSTSLSVGFVRRTHAARRTPPLARTSYDARTAHIVVVLAATHPRGICLNQARAMRRQAPARARLISGVRRVGGTPIVDDDDDEETR